MFTALALAFAQLCAPSPTAGVAVPGSERGFFHTIAATASSVYVAWVAQRTMPPGGNLEGMTETSGRGATFDASTLQPAANNPIAFAGATSYNEMGWFLGQSVALYGDATPVIASCQAELDPNDAAHDLMQRASCEVHSAALTTARWPQLTLSAGPHPRHNRLAATLAPGASALVALPQCQQLRVWNTSTARAIDVGQGSRDACTSDLVEVPAIASDGASSVALVFRQGGRLRGRVLDATGAPQGPLLELAPRGGDFGAPAVQWVGDAFQVVYAFRARDRDPYQLRLVRWAPGAPPAAPEPLVTSPLPAVAPALAATRQPGCAVLSWTEGRGTGTFVRAGRLCANALVASTITQLSHPGVEAGDSELAAANGSIYAVWQELSGPRRSSALFVARVGCP